MSTKLGLDQYVRFSIGLGQGRSEIDPDVENEYNSGSGFAGIGDDEGEDSSCLTGICFDSGKGGTGLGAAYRISAGYTLRTGALVELVALRMGGEGTDIPDGTEAHLTGFMIMISNGL